MALTKKAEAKLRRDRNKLYDAYLILHEMHMPGTGYIHTAIGAIDAQLGDSQTDGKG